MQHNNVVALRENGAERQGSLHTGLVEGSSVEEEHSGRLLKGGQDIMKQPGETFWQEGL